MQVAHHDSDEVTFLLVEDDDLDVRVIEEAFEQQKITNSIVRATNGVEALEILRGEGGRDRIPRPYLILLDLKMPQMNGLEFLDQLRNDPELEDAIVFVLTTSDDDKDKTAAYKKHVAGYLLKQDVGDEFMDAVKMLDFFTLSVHFPAK
jgi:CheY-like chemotaxis protein